MTDTPLDDLSIAELQRGYDICRASIMRIEGGNDSYTNNADLCRSLDAFRKSAGDFATAMARKLREASNAYEEASARAALSSASQDTAEKDT